jgi:hypothetical protein
LKACIIMEVNGGMPLCCFVHPRKLVRSDACVAV